MIRKLAFAVAVLNLAFASMVHALGLGEAEVKSSLNQPLRAEIELVSVKGLQANEILPGLATREEFLKAGVDRVYFLSDLRFRVEKNAAGNLVVILTSAKPVREPFLNFLVEVIWPSGRLLREYALLIDPPLFAEEPAAPVAAPAVTRAPEPRADRVAIPAPAPAPVRRVAPSAPANSYGPTESNDTLWEIAAKVRPDRSVSPQQVMLAIQDLNPRAFIGDNINKLKAGQVLRLPTLDQIRQRSAAQAINEVIAQNQALRPAKSKPVVSASRTQQAAKASVAARGGDELKLLVAKNDADTVGTADSGEEALEGGGSGVDADMAITLEKLDKANLENKELSGRVDDLEEQLATLQRLLALKNDQLAGLQAQARAEEEARLKSEMEQATTIAADQAMPSEDTSADVSETEISTPTADLAETVADEEVLDEEVVDEEVDEPEAKVAKAVSPATEQKPESAPKQVQENMPVREENLFDLVLNNPLYQAVAAAGLIVLLLILWLISNRNAKREQLAHTQENESVAAEEPAFEEEYSEHHDDLEGDDVFDEALDEDEQTSAAAGEHETEEKSGETEDVIAEADVYIAYGRLDQAATVLEQGISSDPVRADYRLKLLEVYAETGDSEAFDRQLSELEAIQDPEAMEKALAIKASMSSGGESVQDDSLELGETHFEKDSAEILEPEASSLAEADSMQAADELSETAPDNSFDFESVEQEDEDEDLGIDLASEDLELDLDIDLEGDSPASSPADTEVDLEPQSSETAEDEHSDAGSIDWEAGSEDVSETTDEDDVEASDEVDASVLDLDEEVSTDAEPDVDAATLELDDEDLTLDEGDSLTGEADEDTEAELDEALDLELGDLELSEELEQESEIELPEDLSIPDEVLDLDQDEMPEPTDVSADEGAEKDAVLEPEEEAVVSDDILDEAVDALADSDELEADLGDDEDFDFLNGTDEASTKLDLARAYIDMGDVDGARDILQEVEKEGNEEQQAEAKDLIESLNK